MKAGPQTRTYHFLKILAAEGPQHRNLAPNGTLPRLMKTGWVEWVPDPGNERAINHLKLTDAGYIHIGRTKP